jgi:molecular chaperone DnaK (HSP70)
MRLGIDFGTCFTSGAYLQAGVPVPVRFGYNTLSLPSAAFVTPQGALLLGTEAEDRRLENPAMFRRHFKRDLGTGIAYRLGPLKVTAEELVARLLAALREAAMLQAPALGPADQAAITVPVSYEAARRGLIVEAARQAGFAEVELLEEPVAAGLHWASGGAPLPEGGTALVYDLGGGTFDAALVGRRGGRLAALGPPVGSDQLGGAALDEAVLTALLRARPGLVPDSPPEGPDGRLARGRRMLRLAEECRALKERLTAAPEAQLFLDSVDGRPLEPFRLTRAELAALAAPLVGETVALCTRLLEEAGLSWDRLDAVLLVGGTCRMPLVREAVARAAGRTPALVDDPALAVCFGAARHAAARWTQAATGGAPRAVDGRRRILGGVGPERPASGG